MRQVLIGISREIEFELRNDLYAHLTTLPARYYQGHRTGDLMSRATNDLSAVRMVLGPGIMYTASTLATFVGTIVFMLRICPRLLLLSLVPLVFVSVLVRYFGRRIHDRFEAVQAQLSEISAVVQENLSGRARGPRLRPGAPRDGALRRPPTRSTCAATASSSACTAASIPASSSSWARERCSCSGWAGAWWWRARSPSASSSPSAPTSPCCTGR